MKKRLLLFISAMLLICFIGYVVLALYVASFVTSMPTKNADTAIILGAKSYKEASFNPCLVSRVKTGETLLKKSHVKYLLMSGGTDTEDQRNESETMKEIAIKDSIAESQIILENKSTSTFENIKNSKYVMEQRGLKTAILVTEPFHIARTRLIAKSLGLNATYEAAATSPCWTRWKYASRYFLKEPLAIVGYVLTGKIKISAFME